MNRLISVVAREAAEDSGGESGGALADGIVTTNASIYYNFLAEDAGKYYRFTHAAPAIWVPNNYFGYAPIPEGARIHGVCTAGQLTITPNGRTVNVADGFQLKTRVAFSWFELRHVGAGVWDLRGDLLPV